jgi:transcriptional regulator with XRE-family HTH domain
MYLTTGEIVRTLREERGWSLRELARRSQSAPSVISRLERNVRSNPTVRVLNRIADALDVPTGALIGDPDEGWKRHGNADH